MSAAPQDYVYLAFDKPANVTSAHDLPVAVVSKIRMSEFSVQPLFLSLRVWGHHCYFTCIWRQNGANMDAYLHLDYHRQTVRHLSACSIFLFSRSHPACLEERQT